MRRLSMRSGAADYYYHYDTLGSVRNVTSSTGIKQWTDTYEPFGAIRTETQDATGAPTNFMKFTGEYLDPTGLYHLRVRQYDPATGRFLQVDPATTPLMQPYGGAYEYVADRATVMTDPSGETFEPADDGLQFAALSSGPDTAAYLASAPPPGYYRCGEADCDGSNPTYGWDEVRGQIKAPRNSAYIYWIRLNSERLLDWGGWFKINALPKVHLWVPFKGMWLHSPVLVGSGPSSPQGYKVSVANPNPHGQTWKVDVEIRSPYHCSKPDPKGFEP